MTLATLAMMFALTVAVALLARGYLQIGKMLGAASSFAAMGLMDTYRCLPHAELPLAAYARQLGWSLLIALPLYLLR